MRESLVPKVFSNVLRLARTDSVAPPVRVTSKPSFLNLAAAFFICAVSMFGFVGRAEEELQHLIAMRDDAAEAFTALVGWLGEDASLQPEALFAMLHTFTIALARADASNVERDEMERKRQRLAA